MEDSDVASAFIPALYKPPSLLPIARHRESILYLVEKYPVVIVVGQTGSGKSTQICQYLDQAGWCADGKAIAVTQVGQYRAAPMDSFLTAYLDFSPEESPQRQWLKE
jgi:predicted ATPase